MGRYVGLDSHARSCTLGVVGLVDRAGLEPATS